MQGRLGTEGVPAPGAEAVAEVGGRHPPLDDDRLAQAGEPVRGLELVEQPVAQVGLLSLESDAAEVGEQQRRSLPAAAGVGAAQVGVVEQRAARTERHRDTVASGGSRQVGVDDLGLGGPARHRADHERRAQLDSEQCGAQLDGGEIASGQRSMAQLKAVEARPEGVQHLWPRGDAQVVGLADPHVVDHCLGYGPRLPRDECRSVSVARVLGRWSGQWLQR